MNNEGKVICSTKEASKITNIPQFRDFQYFRSVTKDIFIFNTPPLTKHKNKNFKKAINSLFSGKVKEEFYTENNKYTIYKSHIAETNWFLLKIIN